jgi:hypothetical protein
MSGPCLTDAALETAPGGLFVRESRYAEARTSTSAVGAALCVYRMCHNVPVIGILADRNQCLADNKACQPYRYA